MTESDRVKWVDRRARAWAEVQEGLFSDQPMMKLVREGWEHEEEGGKEEEECESTFRVNRAD